MLPPPALPPLPAEPIFPLPLSEGDLVFALTVFELIFFSLLRSVCSPLGFSGLDLGCADDLVAFASTVFLGVDLGVGFGVAFGFAVGLGAGVAVGFGFGNFTLRRPLGVAPSPQPVSPRHGGTPRGEGWKPDLSQVEAESEREPA